MFKMREHDSGNGDGLPGVRANTGRGTYASGAATCAATTAAGHVGPNYRMDHDNSMLAPELWCRMRVAEREARFLIENGHLEKVDDLEYEGRRVLASRLGYRITAAFVDRFLGRIFETPGAVFPEDLLRPEKQDLAASSPAENQDRVQPGGVALRRPVRGPRRCAPRPARDRGRTAELLDSVRNIPTSSPPCG